MAKVTYTGNTVVSASDYHAIEWVGVTKSGKACTISCEKAINLGNIDWTFAEKNDTVAQLVFTGVYTNTDNMNRPTVQPWKVELEDGMTAGAGEILLGAGILSVDGTEVALSRGGGSFNVANEFRNINADGDLGPVEGRTTLDGAVATLTVNALTFLTNMNTFYTGINKA